MKSVGDFWFRIGLGVALLFVGLLVSLIGPNGAGILFFILGFAQLAWTAITASLIVRKARKIEGRQSS